MSRKGNEFNPLIYSNSCEQLPMERQFVNYFVKSLVFKHFNEQKMHHLLFPK